MSATLTVRKVSPWRSRYEVMVDGRTVTTWNGAVWRAGGDFELDGRRYQVRGNALGSRFSMLDADGTALASAEGAGRKRWTVQAGGQTYEFQRASWWSNEQELRASGIRVGSVRRTGFWRGHIAVDLPGLPLPVQIFVLGVVITRWDAEDATAATVS